MPAGVTEFLEIGALLDIKIAFPPAGQAAATVNGTGIDRAGQGDSGLFAESALWLVMAGATTGGPTSFTVDAKIQDSADNTTFADIAAAQGGPIAITQIIAANTNRAVKFRLKPLRRYIRCVLTVAFVGGASPTVGVGGSITFGGVQQLPRTLAP